MEMHRGFLDVAGGEAVASDLRLRGDLLLSPRVVYLCGGTSSSTEGWRKETSRRAPLRPITSGFRLWSTSRLPAA